MTDVQLQDHINSEIKADINRLYDHAEVANKEMGTIKTDIAVIKTRFENMERIIRSVSRVQWWIISIILAHAIGTALMMYYIQK